jgi:uncharacterized protein
MTCPDQELSGARRRFCVSVLGIRKNLDFRNWKFARGKESSGKRYGCRHIHFIYIKRVPFEFDPDKSASNKLKHDIDFEEAQRLWEVRGVVVRSDRGDEVRFARIATGRAGQLWTAIYVRRGENIRIISVRRASRTDRKRYEENIS